MTRKPSAERIAALTPAQVAYRERARLRREEAKRECAERKAREAAERNPTLDLPEKDRAELFVRLRDCPYYDAIVEMLKEKGVTATTQQLEEFYIVEARRHWSSRITRAAVEANALIQLAEENPANFSSGILAALGQEAFRQIASGQAQPEAINKMAMLFLRAKADERADQLGELKREKLRLEIRGNLNLALEQLSEEVTKRPEAREKFEALRRELVGGEDK